MNPPGVFPRRALLRQAGTGLASAILPCTIVDEERGLDTAEALLCEGYGLLVIMNHFSLRDAPQALVLLCRSRVMRQREIVAPVALHQYRRHMTPVRLCAALFDIRLSPVVTPRTDPHLYNAAALRHTLKSYIAGATSVLQSGGIVLLAPQAGRESQLGAPAGHPVAQLLRRLPASEVPKVALMFVGFGISGEDDYSLQNAGGVNLGRHYQASVGATVTVQQALQEAGGLRRVDEWAFSRLRPLVPRYLR